MAENDVKSCIEEIKNNLTQRGSSKKDEIKVMRAMLNDRNYEVGVYNKDGLEGVYNPASDYRSMISGVISETTKIPVAEAAQLADRYDVRKSDAESMIRLSKEFVTTFIQTGRKLPLGAREKSNVSLILKEVKESTKSYPRKVGVNEDGSGRYSKAPTRVPAHQSIKVQSGCPAYIK